MKKLFVVFSLASMAFLVSCGDETTYVTACSIALNMRPLAAAAPRTTPTPSVALRTNGKIG